MLKLQLPMSIFFKSPRIESKEHSPGFSKVEREKVHFKSSALISNELYAT